MTGPRTIPALAAAALVVSGLAACSGGPDADELAGIAGELAEGLETGELSQVRWSGDAPQDLSRPLAGMVDLSREVTVVEVGDPRTIADSDDLRVADVELEWSWDLDADGSADWVYTRPAMLARDADGFWGATYDPSMIADGLGTSGELTLTRVPAERGEVLAGDGTAVVTPRPVLRIGIDKTRLPDDAHERDVRGVAEDVANLAGWDDPDGYADQVVAAGPRAFVEAIVVREGSGVVDLAALEEIPAGVALPDEMPLAPTSAWARPVLGRVGQATREVIEASGGTVQAGDEVGLSGLQEQYDDVLRGGSGLRVTSGIGPDAEVVFERDPEPGADLSLTLDAEVQTAAEQSLESTESPAGLVAIRASTGEVLAAASGPGSQGLNTAMLASLAPGSTFKMVTALALLRAGVGPEAQVSCTPDVTVDGYTIGNYPGYPSAWIGDLTLTEALTQSCNSALINARGDVSFDALVDAARSLGLGQQLPGAWPGFTGSVPEDGSETGLASSLIGQGEVLASPLAMATVAASIAAAETVTPTLVTGPEQVADAPSAVDAAPLTAKEADVLADYMRAVVTDGTATLLADVPGEPVHAKTGSAEAGEGEDFRVDSWMIAYQGDLAVAALVHGGGHGAGAAGDVVEAFLRAAAGGGA
ncbi:penicillin-binding transpeptidase domain-containing protein [Georgenia halophila]|uniref:Penicillin-binding transpeptidase domain-containing protein n=1 Tax=Georgenia halophila TaxID=620889 RepID=A0ABP8KYZ3_9MICO